MLAEENKNREMIGAIAESLDNSSGVRTTLKCIRSRRNVVMKHLGVIVEMQMRKRNQEIAQQNGTQRITQP